MDSFESYDVVILDQVQNNMIRSNLIMFAVMTYGFCLHNFLEIQRKISRKNVNDEMNLGIIDFSFCWEVKNVDVLVVNFSLKEKFVPWVETFGFL